MIRGIAKATVKFKPTCVCSNCETEAPASETVTIEIETTYARALVADLGARLEAARVPLAVGWSRYADATLCPACSEKRAAEYAATRGD